jgi:hypothetical protein
MLDEQQGKFVWRNTAAGLAACTPFNLSGRKMLGLETLIYGHPPENKTQSARASRKY